MPRQSHSQKGEYVMNPTLERIYREISPKEQAKLESPPFYIMQLRFILGISFRPDTVLPDTMGIDESIVTPREAIYRTTLVTKTVPDSSLITEYKQKIIASFVQNGKDIRLDFVKFDGYESIHTVLPREEAKNVPTKDALYALVYYAWRAKTIHIEADPNGDGIHNPVLFIDDDWIYFDSSINAEQETPEFYLLKHDEEYLITCITDAIWELYQSDPESAETAFIFAYLYETLEQP